MPDGPFRDLPSVERVRAAIADEQPHAVVIRAAREAVEAARTGIARGRSAPSFDEVVADARRRLQTGDLRGLQPVINATGVLLHTNLGRAPLGAAQLEAVARVSAGYSNLEYDLVEGRRGRRYAHARGLLCAATGAESALVVNNNAAALLVTLATLCADKEVIVSRGELIEIGGEFRIPDVLEASGARMIEVGTTNRTHLSDYERAISPETGALLKVHPSNYEIVGFTASVAPRELARLARGRGVCFVHDVGSGVLADQAWAPGESAVDVALEDGADLVTFSCDKLLGGPQAGVIAGRRDLIDRIARHPLMRAVRVDKMTLAALEATLALYLYGRVDEIPLYALTTALLESLQERAEAIAAEVHDLAAKVEVVATSATPGGGAAPTQTLPSYGVAIDHPEVGPDQLAERLRHSDPPVIGRVDGQRVVLDLRAVFPEQDGLVVGALREALA